MTRNWCYTFAGPPAPLSPGNARLWAFMQRKGITLGTGREARRACYNAPSLWEYRRRLGARSGRPLELRVLDVGCDTAAPSRVVKAPAIASVEDRRDFISDDDEHLDAGTAASTSSSSLDDDDDDRRRRSHRRGRWGRRGEGCIDNVTPQPQATVLRRRGGADECASAGAVDTKPRNDANADARVTTSSSRGGWGAVSNALAFGVKGTMGTFAELGSVLDAANKGTLFAPAGAEPVIIPHTLGDDTLHYERVPTLLGTCGKNEETREDGDDLGIKQWVANRRQEIKKELAGKASGGRAGGWRGSEPCSTHGDGSDENGWSARGWNLAKAVGSMIHTPVHAVAGAVHSGAEVVKAGTTALSDNATKVTGEAVATTTKVTGEAVAATSRATSEAISATVRVTSGAVAATTGVMTGAAATVGGLLATSTTTVTAFAWPLAMHTTPAAASDDDCYQTIPEGEPRTAAPKARDTSLDEDATRTFFTHCPPPHHAALPPPSFTGRAAAPHERAAAASKARTTEEAVRMMYAADLSEWLTDPEEAREEAALKLQAAARGWLTRRYVGPVLKVRAAATTQVQKQRVAAATRIQAVVREWLARNAMCRERAAVGVQRHVRGWLVRRLAASRRRVRLTHTAAAAIQARARGWLARRSLRDAARRKAAAVTMQRFARGTLARLRARARHWAAVVVQARYRGILARATMKKRLAAVLAIQAGYRGRIDRRDVVAPRAAALARMVAASKAVARVECGDGSAAAAAAKTKAADKVHAALERMRREGSSGEDSLGAGTNGETRALSVTNGAKSKTTDKVRAAVERAAAKHRCEQQSSSKTTAAAEANAVSNMVAAAIANVAAARPTGHDVADSVCEAERHATTGGDGAVVVTVALATTGETEEEAESAGAKASSVVKSRVAELKALMDKQLDAKDAIKTNFGSIISL